MKDDIYSSILRAGSRTYFFDLKKTSEGKFYFDITESKFKGENTFERHRLLIFEEELKQFKNEVVELYEKYLELKYQIK